MFHPYGIHDFTHSTNAINIPSLRDYCNTMHLATEPRRGEMFIDKTRGKKQEFRRNGTITHKTNHKTMANTYTQIYIHSVFSPMNRDCLIHPKWEESLYKYITGIVQNNNHKMLAINGMPDHIHILIGMKPNQSVSDLIKDVKANASRWINDNRFVKGNFQWQEGFGAFSYGHSQLDTIIPYINNQKQHHQKKSFKEEYLGFLKKFEVDFKDEYVFNFFYE